MALQFIRKIIKYNLWPFNIATEARVTVVERVLRRSAAARGTESDVRGTLWKWASQSGVDLIGR